MENAVVHPLFHLWLKIKHSFILYSSIVITICTDNEFIRLTFIPNWYEYPTKNALRNFKIEEMMNCQRRENKSTWENGRIVKWLDKKLRVWLFLFFYFVAKNKYRMMLSVKPPTCLLLPHTLHPITKKY